MAKFIKVRFSASGYGSKVSKYQNVEAVLADAECTAGDYNGSVQNYGDEVVALTSDGQEIARWEII